jgi:hypothetical protein
MTMNMLEMLTAREQLMEDIECIIESRIDDDCDGLIEALCDAVCANFPSGTDQTPLV